MRDFDSASPLHTPAVAPRARTQEAPPGGCRLALALAACVTAGACTAGTSGSGASAAGGGSAGEPIARIGGTVLTVEQIQKRIDDQSPFVRARYADAEKKREFLDAAVRFEVLAAEAFARGLDKDPEVLEATKKIIVQRLTRDEFDGRVKLQDVTDAEAQAYFEAHQDEYQKPEMARASLIAIPFGTDKAAAQKLAEDVQRKAADKAKLEDRNWFKELAAQHSADESTQRAGGDLRYITAAETEQKLGAAARGWLFAAETANEVSPVLEGAVDGMGGRGAFLILKRTGWRKAITRSFDQVKSQIRNVVFREKRTASFNGFVDELKRKHDVEVFADKLEQVKVNAQVPPGALDDDGHGHGANPHAGGPHGGAPDKAPDKASDKASDKMRDVDASVPSEDEADQPVAPAAPAPAGAKG